MTSPDYHASYNHDSRSARRASFITPLVGTRKLDRGVALTHFFTSAGRPNEELDLWNDMQVVRQSEGTDHGRYTRSSITASTRNPYDAAAAASSSGNKLKMPSSRMQNILDNRHTSRNPLEKAAIEDVKLPAYRYVPDTRLQEKMAKWRTSIERDTLPRQSKSEERYEQAHRHARFYAENFRSTVGHPASAEHSKTIAMNRSRSSAHHMDDRNDLANLGRPVDRAGRRLRERYRDQVPLRDMFGESQTRQEPRFDRYHISQYTSYEMDDPKDRVTTSKIDSVYPISRNQAHVIQNHTETSPPIVSRLIGYTSSDEETSSSNESVGPGAPTALRALSHSTRTSTTIPPDHAATITAHAQTQLSQSGPPSSILQPAARQTSVLMSKSSDRSPGSGFYAQGVELDPASPLSNASSQASVSSVDMTKARQELHKILAGAGSSGPSQPPRTEGPRRPGELVSLPSRQGPITNPQQASSHSASPSDSSNSATSRRSSAKSGAEANTSKTVNVASSASSDASGTLPIKKSLPLCKDNGTASQAISPLDKAARYRSTPMPSPAVRGVTVADTDDESGSSNTDKDIRKPHESSPHTADAESTAVVPSAQIIPTIVIETPTPDNVERKKHKPKKKRSKEAIPKLPRQVHFASSPTWIDEGDSPLYQPTRSPYKPTPSSVSTSKVPKLPTPFSSPTASQITGSSSSSSGSYSSSNSGSDSETGSDDEEMFVTPLSGATPKAARPKLPRSTGMDMPVITEDDSSGDEERTSAYERSSRGGTSHKAHTETPQSQATHQSAAASHVTTPRTQRRRHEPGSSGLQLPDMPSVSQRKNNHLPGSALSFTLKGCKGTSVYKRLRTLVWDYHSDLEDMNKKREKYWVILIDRLEGMVADMVYALDHVEFKESLPLYTKALGSEKEGLAAWTILTQNQIFEMTEWTEQAAKQTWEIIRGSTEMLNQNITPLPAETGAAFLAINQGFQAMYVYFVTLEKELRDIAAAVGTVFHSYLKHIPSKAELDEMGPERRFEMEVMGDDLLNWLSRVLVEIRSWKKKIDYWHFEKQLTPLRNLDREWVEEIDSASMALLRSLLCFGLCLPKDVRTSVNKKGHLKTFSNPNTPSTTPRLPGSKGAYPPNPGMSIPKTD